MKSDQLSWWKVFLVKGAGPFSFTFWRSIVRVQWQNTMLKTAAVFERWIEMNWVSVSDNCDGQTILLAWMTSAYRISTASRSSTKTQQRCSYRKNVKICAQLTKDKPAGVTVSTVSHIYTTMKTSTSFWFVGQATVHALPFACNRLYLV